MKNKSLVGLLIIFLASCSSQNDQKQVAGDTSTHPVITLENKHLALGIELTGGMYTSLVLKDNPLNPFGWKATPEQMPENNLPHVFKGHFLCTGRWGAPSPGEMDAGIPHNGEVNTETWTHEVIETENARKMVMNCVAPLERLDVTREIVMPASGNYFMVKETFKNNLNIGRLSNIVQHATIAAPFLTETTIINTNATLGFDQRANYDKLEEESFEWPDGKLSDGSVVDLRKVTHEKGFVTTHIFEDSIGWVTALNPDANILMGYIWKTAEYPWLNVWHHPIDGKPFVQGLEFGTTGLGQPYELLLNERVIFYGHNSFEYIDAGEEKTKSWICFMIDIPEELTGVKKLSFDTFQINLEGNEGQSIAIKISTKSVL
jgi:hypothetical protein